MAGPAASVSGCGLWFSGQPGGSCGNLSVPCSKNIRDRKRFSLPGRPRYQSPFSRTHSKNVPCHSPRSSVSDIPSSTAPPHGSPLFPSPGFHIHGNDLTCDHHLVPGIIFNSKAGTQNLDPAGPGLQPDLIRIQTDNPLIIFQVHPPAPGDGDHRLPKSHICRYMKRFGCHLLKLSGHRITSDTLSFLSYVEEHEKSPQSFRLRTLDILSN